MIQFVAIASLIITGALGIGVKVIGILVDDFLNDGIALKEAELSFRARKLEKRSLFFVCQDSSATARTGRRIDRLHTVDPGARSIHLQRRLVSLAAELGSSTAT